MNNLIPMIFSVHPQSLRVKNNTYAYFDRPKVKGPVGIPLSSKKDIDK